MDWATSSALNRRPVAPMIPATPMRNTSPLEELLVLKGKTFLFLRLLDIKKKVDAATAQTAMTPLGNSAAKRI
jgi:hypothetical protein